MRVPKPDRAALRRLRLPAGPVSLAPRRGRPARGPRRLRVIAAALGLVLIAALVGVFWPGPQERHLTAYFSQTIGLYPGDGVRVLGVPIGRVDRVTAEGDRVRVDLSYHAEDPLPPGARAVIVAPTLVSGRYVQLTPAYTGGAQLADGAVIPESRTAVPVEWDDIEQQITKLATDLGPKGANRDGSVSRLLDATAGNLNGNGAELHRSIQRLSAAVSTLSQGSGDFFATVGNLQRLTAALAENDTEVAAFLRRLDSVSGVLDGNRADLAATLSTLDQSLSVVRDFIDGNKDRLGRTLQDLDTETSALSDKRQQLADILQVAPAALGNFQNIYNPVDGGMDGAFATTWLQDPAVFICSTVLSLGGTPKACQQAVAPLADLLKMDNLPVGLDLLNRNGTPNQAAPNSKSLSSGAGSGSGAGSSGSGSGAGSGSGSGSGSGPGSGLLGLLGGGK